MAHTSGNRYFDGATILLLGLTAFLLVSLPGGCWSDDGEGDDEPVAEGSDEGGSPTPVPTMEIVDPEPGDIDTADIPEDDEQVEEGSGEEAPDESGEQDPPDTPEDGTYVVQEGDTLYAIAVDFGVTMEDLMAANGIEDANSLQVGQELTIP